MALILNVTNLRMTVATLYGTPGASGSLSLSQGTGIVNTPNPITGTGTIALAVPVAVANGGTGTSTTLTQGSVVFAGAAGVYSQDNANFFWDATNHRLGIGTTAPSDLLHVNGSSAVRARIQTTGATSNAVANFQGVAREWFVGHVSAAGSGFPTDILAFRDVTAPAYRMVIDTSGNVGIGTTAPAFALHVAIPTTANPVAILNGTGNSSQYGLGFYNDNVNANTRSWALSADNVAFGDFQIRTSNLRAGNPFSAGTARLHIDNAGNIGIGTTGPSGPLHIVDATANNRTFRTSGAGTAGQYWSGDNTGATFAVGLDSSVGGALISGGLPYATFLQSTTNTPLELGTNNAVRMVILGAGNVGIGTTTPPSKLSVAGTIEMTAGSGGVLKFADGTSQASAAAGGGTVTGTGTATNVAFWSAGSTISSDNALYWDNANKRLGIGTSSPDNVLTVSKNASALPAAAADSVIHFAAADGSNCRLTMDAFGAVAANFTGRKASGTAAAPTGVAAGDLILQLSGIGRGATGYSAARAAIAFSSDEAITWTDAAQGSKITFTTSANGTAVSTERVRIDNAGQVGIGTTTPGSVLDVKDNASTCLRLSGSTSGYVGLRPAAVAGTVTYTLPSADSTGTQYLRSNGAGVLTWGTPAGAGTVTTNGALSAGMVTFIDPAGSTIITGEGNLFYDNTNNRLGILTSAPIAPLHVGAQTNAPVLTSQILVDVAGSSYITAKDTTDSTEAAFGADSTGAVVGSQSASPLNLQAGGLTKVVIPTSGGIRLNGASSGYVGLQGATNAGSTTYTLPTADGQLGQVLKTNGAGVLSWTDPTTFFTPEMFGGKADAVTNSGGTITAATQILTLSGGGGTTFTANDVGKTICVLGAGAAGGVLKTTISGYTSSTQVTLTAAASTTVVLSNVIWGTDSTTAIQTMFTNYSTQTSFGTRYQFGQGAYLVTDECSCSTNAAIFGASSVATSIFFCPTSTGKALFKLTGFNIRYDIRDFYFQGPFTQTTAYAILTTQQTYWGSGVSNCYFYGFDTGMRLTGSGSNNEVMVTNCQFQHMGTYSMANIGVSTAWEIRGVNSYTYALPFTATVSNGSSTVTTGSPLFSNQWIGCRIVIAGAGVAGAALVTTITAVASSTSCTIASPSQATGAKAAEISENQQAHLYVESGGIYGIELACVGGARSVWCNPGNGQGIVGVFLTSCTLDSVWGDGNFVLTPTGTGYADDIRVTGCWIASANASGFGATTQLSGVYINSPSLSQVKLVTFTEVHFLNHAKMGAWLSGVWGIRFNGCSFDSNGGQTTNTYPHLFIQNCQDQSVTNCIFAQIINPPGNSVNYGAQFTAGCTGNLVLTGNSFRDYLTSAWLNSSGIAGNHLIIANNAF